MVFIWRHWRQNSPKGACLKLRKLFFKHYLKTFLDKFRKRLSKQGATYLYNETDGAHSWENWRKYLLDFLPRIFNY